jgi:hypothetical protein
MDDRSEPKRRLDALYVAVRDSATVDREAAFDIAMNELGYLPLHAEARELAEASAADGDETRLASAAAAFLDAYGYEPGFEQAPERFARLERALDAVRADMRATGLTGEVRLVRPDWASGNTAVETWAGDQGWTGGISSSDAADDLSALVAVAEQARQAILESLEYQSTGESVACLPNAWSRDVTRGAPRHRRLVVRRGRWPRVCGDRPLGGEQQAEGRNGAHSDTRASYQRPPLRSRLLPFAWPGPLSPM